MRSILRLLELAAFLALVWLAISCLRYLAGEPWSAILARPLGFIP